MFPCRRQSSGSPSVGPSRPARRSRAGGEGPRWRAQLRRRVRPARARPFKKRAPVTGAKCHAVKTGQGRPLSPFPEARARLWPRACSPAPLGRRKGGLTTLAPATAIVSATGEAAPPLPPWTRTAVVVNPTRCTQKGETRHGVRDGVNAPGMRARRRSAPWERWPPLPSYWPWHPGGHPAADPQQIKPPSGRVLRSAHREFPLQDLHNRARRGPQRSASDHGQERVERLVGTW